MNWQFYIRKGGFSREKIVFATWNQENGSDYIYRSGRPVYHSGGIVMHFVNHGQLLSPISFESALSLLESEEAKEYFCHKVIGVSYDPILFQGPPEYQSIQSIINLLIKNRAFCADSAFFLEKKKNYDTNALNFLLNGKQVFRSKHNPNFYYLPENSD